MDFDACVIQHGDVLGAVPLWLHRAEAVEFVVGKGDRGEGGSSSLVVLEPFFNMVWRVIAMRKTKLAVLLLAGFPMLAFAGFQIVGGKVVEKPDGPEVISSSSVPGKSSAASPVIKGGKVVHVQPVAGVNHIGEMQSKQLHVVSLSGDSAWLEKGVKKIIPKGWKVFAGDLARMEVDWPAGQTWVDTLDFIAKDSDNDLQIAVDWNRKAVYIAKNEAKSQVSVKTEPARPAPLSLRKGDRLSEVFSSWGQANGWDVTWQAPALISDIDITFTDGFESAVTQTIESLVKQGLPLRVVFYEGNKVVLIMGAN